MWTEFKRAAASVNITMVKDDQKGVVVCIPCVVGFGWTRQYHSHMAVPLVLQISIGSTVQINLTSLNALTADYYPDRTSIMQAASDLFRCDDAGHSVSGAVSGGAVWPEWRKKGKQCIRGA
ncbi:hypothetical protein BB8028_0002g15310 [Beauveria bassiana]|uniref:Uncharacterized protein n=1 Tax=Beauveria bassiana TaxID=176275 RepID=A0A2S7Y5I5_BEABA|nr:hypothetical protein BB8028_0002g15310 [Beauveria bassiana]